MSSGTGFDTHRSRRGLRLALCAVIALAVVVPLGTAPLSAAPRAAAAVAGTTTRVSLTDSDNEADDRSQDFSMSTDGRYVVFESYAANLVAGDTNGQVDIFVRDTELDTTERINLSTAGVQTNDYSFSPKISADGNFVVFASWATNLVANDTNAGPDIFVRDLVNNVTVRVSVKTDGTQANGASMNPTINWNGTAVAFASDATNLVTFGTGSDDTNGFRDIFVHVMSTGDTRLESRNGSGVLGNGNSSNPVFSGNSTYVVFQSNATNLVGGDTNGATDIFSRIPSAGTTDRLSVDTNGVQANGDSINPQNSTDGRFIVFLSYASNLVANDTNGTCDVFMRDMGDGSNSTTERINLSSDELQANGTPVSVASQHLAVTADGRYVVFPSSATNLVSGDTNGSMDVFVRDRTSGTTERVSLDSSGVQPTNNSGYYGMGISSDARYVAFASDAVNLVSGDTNLKSDIFVHDRLGDPITYVNVEGADRFETAVEASKLAYPDGLSKTGDRTIIIATGRNWPDALGGVSLAGVLDGPILLVDTNSVPADVAAEIERLDPLKAIILGGTSAVGPTVEGQLVAGFGDANVERIDGATRYETADKIALRVIDEQGGAYTGMGFVATGGNFPDALAVAPAAARMGWPLYLSNPATGLTSGTKIAMADVTEAVILGGTSAVSQGVEDYLLNELGPGKAWRIEGANRYETAVHIAEESVDEAGLGWNRVGITTGEKFPDALAGGVLQAKMGSVMLLTPSASLDSIAQAALVNNRGDIDQVTFFGGTSAVSQSVRDAVLLAIE